MDDFVNLRDGTIIVDTSIDVLALGQGGSPTYPVPDDVPPHVRALLEAALAGASTPDAQRNERMTLYKWFTKDESLLQNIFIKSPDMSDSEWALHRQLQTLVSTTACATQLLVNNLVGGGHQGGARSGTKAVRDRVNDFFASTEYKQAFARIQTQKVLYGTCYYALDDEDEVCVPDMRFARPIVDLYKREFVGWAEYLPVCKAVLVQTVYGRGIFYKDIEHTEWETYATERNRVGVAYGSQPITRDFTGVSLVRECPRIDSNLCQLFYGAAVASRRAAINLLRFKNTSNSGIEVNNYGHFSLMTIAADDEIDTIDTKTNIEGILAAVENLMSIESTLLALPTSANIRSHQSATGSELSTNNLTSRLDSLAVTTQDEEVKLLAQLAELISGLPAAQCIRKFGIFSHITTSADKLTLVAASAVLPNLVTSGLLLHEDAAAMVYEGLPPSAVAQEKPNKNVSQDSPKPAGKQIEDPETESGE